MRALAALIVVLNLVCDVQVLALTNSKVRLHLRTDKTSAGRIDTSAEIANSLKFYVYTRHNANEAQIIEPEVESVVWNVFQPWKPTTISIPRWRGSLEAAENQAVVQTKLNQEDCNVLVVDWSEIPSDVTRDAVTTAPFVAEAIADFLLLLHKHFDVSFQTIHLAGFSEGAHVAGLTGRSVYVRTGAKVQHITALDPEGLSFALIDHESERLSADDADFVEVVHTSAGSLGYLPPIGHADYYPNGGAVQPNCDIENPTCSHERAYEYLSEMWSQQNGFVVTKCATVEDMSLEHCDWVNVKMGQNREKKGLYYLETNGAFPYAKGSFVTKFW